MEYQTKGVLEGCRVLELAEGNCLIVGKILADLGAEVIKIELPGGDPTRNTGPFYHDIPDIEKSLYWLAFNTGKKSITLNIEREDGKRIFKQLVRTADFIVESYRPGY